MTIDTNRLPRLAEALERIEHDTRDLDGRPDPVERPARTADPLVVAIADAMDQAAAEAGIVLAGSHAFLLARAVAQTPYVLEALRPPVNAPRVSPGPRETSRDAARRIAVKAGTVRETVLAEIRRAGETGRTDDEVEEVLSLLHTTASSTRRGLVLDGYVVDSGRRRDTRNGHHATVWVAR